MKLNKLSKKLKKILIKNVSMYGDSKTYASSEGSYTGNELAIEIEDESKLGIRFFKNTIGLTIDLLKRNKITNKWNDVIDVPLPKSKKEFLVRNDRQGGVKTLIYWNNIHNKYYTKGQAILNIDNYATHWIKIPKY